MSDVDTSQEMTTADGLVIKWVDVVNLKEQDLNAQVMEPRKFDALTQNIKLRGMQWNHCRTVRNRTEKGR